MKKSIIFLLLASLCIFNVDAQKKIPQTYRPLGVKPTQRTEIILPEVNGFKCYKGDFHIHTSYSDGRVNPKGRVLEAWYDGLDVIAITDHYQSGKFHHATAFNGFADAVNGNYGFLVFADNFFSSGQSSFLPFLRT